MKKKHCECSFYSSYEFESTEPKYLAHEIREFLIEHLDANRNGLDQPTIFSKEESVAYEFGKCGAEYYIVWESGPFEWAVALSLDATFPDNFIIDAWNGHTLTISILAKSNLES